MYKELCPDYNRDLLETIKPTVKVIIGTSIIVALLLDILCYKYRRLSQAILYFEGAASLIFTLIPSRYYLELPVFYFMIFYVVMFIAFYCDSGGQVIYLSVILAIQFLVVQTVGYNNFSIGRILGGISMTVLFFLFCSFIAMIIVYTKNLEKKKDNALKANI